MLDKSGGAQIEFCPCYSALNERNSALVCLNVYDGWEGVEPFSLGSLEYRLFNHRFSGGRESAQDRQKAFFNRGYGKAHRSFQPLEVSKSFMHPAGGCTVGCNFLSCELGLFCWSPFWPCL